MTKPLFALVLCLVLFQAAQAEKADSTIYYYKNSGRLVHSRDSADFYRVILPPDTNIDKDLYRVYDYYGNGKLRRVATSINANTDVLLEGTCMDYYPNGKRREVSQYKSGNLIGEISDYYPSGKLYAIFKIEDTRYYNTYSPRSSFLYRYLVEEMRDTTGNVLVKNGTGHVILFDEDYKKMILEGDLKNNRKEGVWKGNIADSGKFVCNFHRDDLQSGVSNMNSGHQYTFKQFIVHAVYSDGMREFSDYLKKNVHFPESAKKHKVTGTVRVEFYVETDGRITDVKIVRSIFKSLDDEAVRVVSSSPPWIPEYRFGIPIRSAYTVSVDFY